MDECYRWTPLQHGRQIRVVHIAPSRSLNDIIYCRLEISSVDEPCQYRAISYSWGQTQQDGSHLTDVILCDGKVMRVTRHLNMALKRIRQDQRPWHRKLPLWVDAISIDQTDTSEKADQVKMMDHIFERARHLTIWLGEAADKAEQRIYSRIEKRFYEWEELGGSLSLDDAEKDAMQNLLCRDWFERRWIIQEVLVTHIAGKVPLFRVGSVAWNWPFFNEVVGQLAPSEALDRFSTLTSRVNTDFSMLSTGAIADPYPNMSGSSRRAMSAGVLQTMHVFDHAQCYDARDRLFALFNITFGAEHVPVSYDIEVHELYWKLASSLILQAMSIVNPHPLLQVLGHASCRKIRDPNSSGTVLPSWVPDWRRRIHYENEAHRQAVAFCVSGSILGDAQISDQVAEVGRTLLKLQGWLITPCTCSSDSSDDSRLPGVECLPCRLADEARGLDLGGDSDLVIQALRSLEDSQVILLLQGSPLAFVLRTTTQAASKQYALDSCFVIAGHVSCMGWYRDVLSTLSKANIKVA